jgi:ribosomal protein L18
VVACAYDTWIEGTKKEKAFAVWKAVASLAKSNWVTEVVFDRNWYLYHWRVAQVAEWARQEWLVF